MDSFWSGFEKAAALRATTALEPHQERVKRRLEKKPGLLVYHGLGSGKTLSSLAATQGMKTDVVVPASLRNNYRKEVEKHTTGFKPNVMSYEGATKTGPTPGSKALVVDEAHNLGDTQSKRTQAMLAQAPAYQRRMLLTGTPIKNRPSELAPLLRMVRGDSAVPLDPKAFDARFVEERAHKPGFFAKVLHGAKPGVTYHMKNKKEFSDLVKGYVDFYEPDKAHFPSVSHETIEVPLNKEQNEYNSYLLGKAGPALRWKIKSGMPPSKREAAQLNAFLSGARQVGNSTKAFGGSGVSPKFQRALTELEERNNQNPNFRGLVYSNYLGSGVKQYAEELDKRGISNRLFTGSLSDKERRQAVEDYNNGKVKVLLISGAGAHGLDLKGTRLVQLMESAWHQPKLEQAAGRAIRFKSHEHLPPDQRHVEVQQYLSSQPKTLMNKLLKTKQDLSADQYLNRLSQEKARTNEEFLSVLRAEGQRE